MGAVVDKEGGEEFARVGNGGNHGAVRGVGRRVFAVGVDDERWEAGCVTEVLGHELVERDGVFGAGSFGDVGGGEDGAFGVTAALYSGMGGAGDDGEFVADVLEGFEVRRRGVVVALILGDEEGIVESEGEGDADEALGLDRVAGTEGGGHLTRNWWWQSG